MGAVSCWSIVLILVFFSLPIHGSEMKTSHQSEDGFLFEEKFCMERLSEISSFELVASPEVLEIQSVFLALVCPRISKDCTEHVINIKSLPFFSKPECFDVLPKKTRAFIEQSFKITRKEKKALKTEIHDVTVEKEISMLENEEKSDEEGNSDIKDHHVTDNEEIFVTKKAESFMNEQEILVAGKEESLVTKEAKTEKQDHTVTDEVKIRKIEKEDSTTQKTKYLTEKEEHSRQQTFDIESGVSIHSTVGSCYSSTRDWHSMKRISKEAAKYISKDDFREILSAGHLSSVTNFLAALIRLTPTAFSAISKAHLKNSAAWGLLWMDKVSSTYLIDKPDSPLERLHQFSPEQESFIGKFLRRKNLKQDVIEGATFASSTTGLLFVSLKSAFPTWLQHSFSLMKQMEALDLYSLWFFHQSFVEDEKTQHKFLVTVHSSTKKITVASYLSSLSVYDQISVATEICIFVLNFADSSIRIDKNIVAIENSRDLYMTAFDVFVGDLSEEIPRQRRCHIFHDFYLSCSQHDSKILTNVAHCFLTYFCTDE